VISFYPWKEREKFVKIIAKLLKNYAIINKKAANIYTLICRINDV